MPKTLDILIPKVTRKVTFPGILPGTGVGRTKITWWQARAEINKGIFQLYTTESSSFNEQFTHRWRKMKKRGKRRNKLATQMSLSWKRKGLLPGDVFNYFSLLTSTILWYNNKDTSSSRFVQVPGAELLEFLGLHELQGWEEPLSLLLKKSL